MAKQELIEYIKKQTAQGRDKEEIKNALTNAGWQAQDIEEGFKVVELNIPMSQSAEQISGTVGSAANQGVKSFSISEALSFGFNTWKNNLGLFVIVILAAILVYVLPGLVGRLIGLSPNNFLIRILTGILSLIIGMGFIKILLKLHDNQKTDFMDLFSQISLILNFFIVSALSNLAVGIALVFFIVPGIIVYIEFQFVKYAVIDKRLGLKAFNVSRQLAKGVKWNLFLFNLTFLAINFVGYIFLGIGLLITLPVTMLAEAYIYRKLLAQTAGVEMIK